jgi:hypothetical protein
VAFPRRQSVAAVDDTRTGGPPALPQASAGRTDSSEPFARPSGQSRAAARCIAGPSQRTLWRPPESLAPVSSTRRRTSRCEERSLEALDRPALASWRRRLAREAGASDPRLADGRGYVGVGHRHRHERRRDRLRGSSCGPSASSGAPGAPMGGSLARVRPTAVSSLALSHRKPRALPGDEATSNFGSAVSQCCL